MYVILMIKCQSWYPNFVMLYEFFLIVVGALIVHAKIIQCGYCRCPLEVKRMLPLLMCFSLSNIMAAVRYNPVYMFAWSRWKKWYCLKPQRKREAVNQLMPLGHQGEERWNATCRLWYSLIYSRTTFLYTVSPFGEYQSAVAYCFCFHIQLSVVYETGKYIIGIKLNAF